MGDIREVLSQPGRFLPLGQDHPAVGKPCAGCDQPIAAGDRVALVNASPATDQDAQRQRTGRAYNAEVRLAHEGCAFPP